MAKLTRKSYKRKKIAFAAILLGGVALVSSGFAAWVLSGQAKQDNTGSVNVGTVVNGALKMNVYHYGSADNIKGEKIETGKELTEYFSFNAQESDKEGNVRWIEKEGEKPELLENKFVVEVLSKTQDSLQDLTVKFSIDKDKEEGFKTLVNGKFITMPTSFENDGQKITKASEGSSWAKSGTNYTLDASSSANAEGYYTWTFVYTVSFAWGDRFNNANPGLFFDSEETSKDSVDERTSADRLGDGYGTKKGKDVDIDVVDADLTKMHDVADGAKYTILFTATGM